jgi:hypothetical protein
MNSCFLPNNLYDLQNTLTVDPTAQVGSICNSFVLRSPVRIPAGTPTVITDGLGGFPQSVEANSKTVPLIRTWPLPFTSLSINYSLSHNHWLHALRNLFPCSNSTTQATRSDTTQSVELLSQRPLPDITTDRHPRSGGIRTHNTSKHAAADPRLVQSKLLSENKLQIN